MTAQQAACIFLNDFLPDEILSAMDEYEQHSGERGYREHYKTRYNYRDEPIEQEKSQRATADHWEIF